MSDKKKIILRRGSGIDLPGKPRKISPKQWNRSLDAGEMAYSEDDGRIFVGPHPQSTLPQSRRLEYPYKNIEVVGENSFDAFARMHGDRMREGDNRDYYETILTPASVPADLVPTGFVAATVIVRSNITSFNGRRVRNFAIENYSPVAVPRGVSERLPTPAQYWRIREGNLGSKSNLSIENNLCIQDMTMAESLGGPNILNQAQIRTQEGGTNKDFFYTPGDNPSQAIDGSPLTVYQGRRPLTDINGPLTIPPHGIAFDFGVGNEKWIAETSYVWSNPPEAFSFTDNAIDICVEFSYDGLNWIKAYKGSSSWPVHNQLRYIPERIDPLPNNLTRQGLITFRPREGTYNVSVAEVSLHATVGGPALNIWCATPQLRTVYDGTVLTEARSTNGPMDIRLRLFNKSTVVQVKVTGPFNVLEAPSEIAMRFSDDEFIFSIDGEGTFSNLTWTSNEVKTFDVVINNTEYSDALQVPLIF